MKISVLMSSYNPIEKYFEKAIRSVLNQTYQNFELIIIDDGSEIIITNLLLKLNIKDARIKVIRSEQNLGLAKALNLGLKYCEGKYIARMDDDDICHKERFQQQLDYLKKNKQFVGCWGSYNRIDESDNFIGENIIIENTDKFLPILLSKGNIFAHSTLFIDTELIKQINGYDENLRYGQDADLYLRVLENYKMGYVEKKILDFRVTKARQNIYKDSFSSICSLFGAYSFFLRNYSNRKYRLLFYKRVLVFIYCNVFKYPKNLYKQRS